MTECPNCGYKNCYLDRFCYNCRWDFQMDERTDLPEKFHEHKIWKVDKQALESFIYNIDILIDRIVKDEYKTKKHIQDEFRKFCSYRAEEYDLETGIKYWEIIQ